MIQTADGNPRLRKLLFVAPHLSTGGMPQYLLKMIESMKDSFDVYCFEYSHVSDKFIVQRDKIRNLLGTSFYSVTAGMTLPDVVKAVSPDIIHLQELPEYFMHPDDCNFLYTADRNFFIVETSHDSSFNPDNKKWFPDQFVLVSRYQKELLSKLNIPIEIIEYDIEKHPRQDREIGLTALNLNPSLKHVLMVGLFTPRKNQKEFIEYARSLESYPIQFHIVGNMADNFAAYWTPLVSDLPSNVVVWGERGDVDRFYSCMDLFLFTSRGSDHDKETSPLVIREALSYQLPILIYNLPVYMGMYDRFDNIRYLSTKFEDNIKKILEILNLDTSFQFDTIKTPDFVYTRQDIEKISKCTSMLEAMDINGVSYDGMVWGIFCHKEMDRHGLRIQPGDVFLDLGANVGMSSMYAKLAGASKIYCVEPDPVMVKFIQQNLQDNVTILECAVWSEPRTLDLYHWPGNPSQGGNLYTTKTRTLSDILNELDHRIIDYVKMDVEGSEGEILTSTPQRYLRRIKKMFIEHHYPAKTHLLVEHLTESGFTVVVENGSGQDYLYCTNQMLTDYDTAKLSITFNPDTNEFRYQVNKNIDDFRLVIRDKQSSSILWTVKYSAIHQNSSYWVIPFPVDFIKIQDDPNIGSLVFDVYSGEKLITSEEIKIKDVPNVDNYIPLLENNTEPNYINYREFFVSKIYDDVLSADYNLVVDVGANVGMWVEYIKNRVPSAEIVCLEPNDVAHKLLTQSFRHDSSVTVIKCALHTEDTSLDFFTNPNNSTISSAYNTTDKSSVYKVDAISIDTLRENIGNKMIDLMKIDIEGGEYDLINSMQDFDFVREFLIEYHIFNNYTMDDVNRLCNHLAENMFIVDMRVMHNGGGFIHAKRATEKRNSKIPFKVKAVHLLLDSDTVKDQQDKSIENISSVCSELGIEYVQHINQLYVDIPPIQRCRYPTDVTSGKLRSEHYGCYDSFKCAILSECTKDYDLVLFFEGDAQIRDSFNFAKALTHAIDNQLNGYISFGGKYDIETSFLQSHTISTLSGGFITTNKIIGCQCIALTPAIINSIKTLLRTEKWCAWDIFLNIITEENGITKIVTEKTIVSQFDGVSTIDSVMKKFRKDLP